MMVSFSVPISASYKLFLVLICRGLTQHGLSCLQKAQLDHNTSRKLSQLTQHNSKDTDKCIYTLRDSLRTLNV